MFIKMLVDGVEPPKKQREGDAGFDVHSPTDAIIPSGERLQVKLGFALEILPDEVAIMSERSGMSIKFGITSIGNIIDSNYRGECSIILANLGKDLFVIKRGDRIGQVIVCRLGNQDVQLVKELSKTERGDKAHYSSGV